MNTSESINELAAALALAQGEIRNPSKGRENPHFKSRYADLAGGLDVVRPALSKHGLSVVQLTASEGDLMTLHTRLMHASGQWIESTYPVCRLGKHQEMGSALTYARRYALFAAVGVAGEDEDDDGNAASDAQPGRKPAARVSSNALKKNKPDLWPTMEAKARAARTVDELTAVWNEYADEADVWPQSWKDQMWELFESCTTALNHTTQQAAE